MNGVTSIKNCTSDSRTDLFSFKLLPTQYCTNIFFIWCSNLLGLTPAPQIRVDAMQELTWLQLRVENQSRGRRERYEKRPLCQPEGPAQSNVKCLHRGPAFAFPVLENVKAQHRRWQQGGCSWGSPRGLFAGKRRNTDGLLMVPHSAVLVQSRWL